MNQAVKAISTQQAVAGCAAGSGSDVIKLESGKTYQLQQSLELGGATKINKKGDPVAIKPHLTLELKRAVFDQGIHDNAIIQASAQQRAIFVHAGVSLTLKSITLRGADISARTATSPIAGPNGGVIYDQGRLVLKEGTVITHGTAKNGGGIYLDSRNGAPSLALTNGQVVENQATAKGGGIGSSEATAASAASSGVQGNNSVAIEAKRFYIAQNRAAKGGGLYVDGKHSSTELYSGTLYKNSASQQGAAVDFATGRLPGSDRASLVLNVTIVANSGSPALYYSDLCQQADSTDASKCSLYAPPGDFKTDAAGKPTSTWLPADTARMDLLFNSALVGNPQGGCALDAAAGHQWTLGQYLHSAYTVTAVNSGCPIAQPGGGGYQQASLAVLANNNGKPCQRGACQPTDFGRLHYHLKGFFPASLGGQQTASSLVNRGSPANSTRYVCAQVDERDMGRSDRCDAGAVELRIAKGAADNIDHITTAKPVWLDVVKNDLGDESIDCTKVSDCISFPLLPQYGGKVEVVYAQGPLADAHDDSKVYQTAKPPVTRSAPNKQYHYPLVRYQSAGGFHGQEQFIYEIDPKALSGAVFANRPPRGRVSLSVAPANHFKSKDISDYGSSGGGLGAWMLLGLLLLGFVRTTCRRPAADIKVGPSRLKRLVSYGGAAGLALWMLLFCLSANADIMVNSTADPVNLSQAYNDGHCTLREALERSEDNRPSGNTDCASGVDGKDTIKLPKGTITLHSNLDIKLDNSVRIEGQGVKQSIIDGAGKYRIDTQSPLTLATLTFRHGHAAINASTGSGNGGAVFATRGLTLSHVRFLDNHASGDGGAIYLNFSEPGASYGLTINRSYFKGNSSDGDGGVISTVGQQQRLEVAITASTFAGNKATGKGGVVDANLASHGKLFVANSIMTANQAGLGGRAIDLTDAAADVQVGLVNDSFLNDATSPANFIAVGQTRVTLSNSIVAGPEMGCSAALSGDDFNLYAPSEPASCGDKTSPHSTAMAASIADIKALFGKLIDTNNSANAAPNNYVPPLFRLPGPGQNASNYPHDSDGAIILDRGNPAGMSSGEGSLSVCRNVDMRGQSRHSQAVAPPVGANATSSCDLGAFEVQRLTARDDKVTTLASRADGKLLTSRQGRVDVLSNDIAADGASIATDKIGFLTKQGVKVMPAQGAQLSLSQLVAGTYSATNQDGNKTSLKLAAPSPAGITAKLSWVAKKAGDPPCRAGDDCGLLVDFDRAAVNRHYGNDAHNPKPLLCPNGDSPTIDIPYVVYDSKGNIASATLKVKMTDVVPQFAHHSIRVHTKPDRDVRIPIAVTDPDGHINSINIAKHGDPQFAEVDKAKFKAKQQSGDVNIHPAWGTGVVWNGSLSHPVITYKHADKTQRFDDVFSIVVTDNCGATSTMTIHIDFPHSDDGGSGGGGLGWGLLGLVGLGLLRRRRGHSSQH